MISVILVDYNTIKKTIEYIRHVNNNLKCNGDINYIIIDNYHSNNTVELLRSISRHENSYEFETYSVHEFDIDGIKCLYCNSGANLGYAKGNNLGVRISEYFINDKYYLISNNDLEFTRVLNWDEIANVFNEHNDVCVIGPKVTDKNGNNQSPNRKMEIWADFVWQYIVCLRPLHWRGDLDYSPTNKYCYRVSGCFIFVRADYFLKAGKFDESTFMYAEEMILSERLLESGYRCYFYNDFHIIHNHGYTVYNNSSWLKPAEWTYDSYCYYFKKYRKASSLAMFLAKMTYSSYIIRRKIRQPIKELIWKARRKNDNTKHIV